MTPTRSPLECLPMLRPASSARPPTRAAAAPAPAGGRGSHRPLRGQARHLSHQDHEQGAHAAPDRRRVEVSAHDQRPRAHQRPRRHGAYEDRPKFYYGEVGGTIRGKRLGELVRDYSRAFHTSVGELRRERLTDFLMEYYEAAEEAKRQRDKAASMPRNNFRKYRRR